MLRILFTIQFLLLILGGSIPCTASNLAKAEKQVQQNLAREAQAQKSLEAWENQKASIEARIRDLILEKTWLEYQNQKYQGYIQRELAELDELETRKKEMEHINMRLEPFLDETVANLKALVATDLPFLPEERARRIAFLEESLGDYHLSLSEKLRRVLEALQVEADYGRTLEATDASITLDDTTIQGRIFRLGRIGLFFQSIDKRVISRFDASTRTWVPLSTDYERDLDQALQMVDRKRAASLLVLPVQGGSRE
ncbi:DUF3450 domain-containing protein [Desulfoplanes formicivorans]|uniref:DUF3450 domain-containing protein n=1 Tax=Desulfoplanes formicivorans TaxID=1592317 RepID=A0A194AE37_9BACT|nr:DUF3450 domain-containing protein [Desulfoplanes formicivorans]GAU07391.1 hypothetical protein DPF_0069 [Desulfoplanes formicivorans]